MKWIPIEPTEGQFEVETPDKMIAWAERNKLEVRGHTLLWAKTKTNPVWTHALFGETFTAAVNRHLDQTLSHFHPMGVKKWDVINEMVDQGLDNHTFYMDHSGDPAVRVDIYKHVRATYPGTTLFVSDYGIVADKYERFGRTQIDCLGWFYIF